MIQTYVDALGGALAGLLDLLGRLPLPLAVLLGILLLGGAVIGGLGRERGWFSGLPWRGIAAAGGRGLGLALLVLLGWTALGSATALAKEDLHSRATADATVEPLSDAPAVYQYGPVAAALEARTYTRTLTLPPAFLQHLGDEGVGALAPYLTDPTSDNVLRLADTFRRSGKHVVFTREVTRRDEMPLPFTSARVAANFTRLGGRAYDLVFEGRYSFRNTQERAIDARLQFPLPTAGTLHDLSLTVSGQAVPEPAAGGVYEWAGRMAPGETRDVVCRYRLNGGGTWRYDLGSQRRRVQQFHLAAVTGGPVRFHRGSLQPTTTAGNTLTWDLSDVVTAQQISLSFPPDGAGLAVYVQTLDAIPVGLLLVLAGAWVLGILLHRPPRAGRLAAALALFCLGMGGAPVLAQYVGPLAGVLLGALVAAALVVSVLGSRYAVAAVPAALFPAAFLSPTHTGLLVLLLGLATLAALRRALVLTRRAGITAAADGPAMVR